MRSVRLADLRLCERGVKLMPSCQPLKASFLVFTFFTPLIFVLFHIYLFIYTKSFGVCPYLLKMSRFFFFFLFGCFRRCWGILEKEIYWERREKGV